MTSYIASQATGTGDPIAIVGALAAAMTLALVIGLVCWVAFRFGSDDDESDPGDEGPGCRREPPRTPPPDPEVSWPEFEKQFADHVASLAPTSPAVGGRSNRSV